MTISQSRYGMNAEVGRNPNRPARERDRYGNIVIGGAGLAAGGAGAMAAGRQMPKMADARYRRAEAALGAKELELSEALRRKKKSSHLRGELAGLGRGRDAAREALETASRRGRLMSRGGAGALAAGLGVTGLAALMNERRRGTGGYRRPSRAEVASRVAAQQNVGRANVEAARVEGDRYRAMGR